MTLEEDLGSCEADAGKVDNCVADLRLLEVGMTAVLTVGVALVQFLEATSQCTVN